MTKRDLITQQNKLMNYAHEHNLAVENFVKVIEAAISGLSNMCPDTAVEIIEDLVTKIPAIKTLKEVKEASDKKFIDETIPYIRDTIEFEEEETKKEDFN